MTTSPTALPQSPTRTVLDMTGYQWTVLFAAWLGWGFDVFDGLLYTFVAPNCLPTLLHLQIGSPAAAQATIKWNGILSSLLLIFWAIGGILFGRVADRIGRTKTLLITMALYSFGTAACAVAPNIWALILFRIVSSLGIGGEWAAGAAMVAEVVPEKRRVEAGAILYTSAPVGLFLASVVNYQIAGVLLKGSPAVSWRYVFLCGLIPAFIAMLVRMFVKEPERWKAIAAKSAPPQISELFSPQYRALTIGGLCMALTALIAWWSSSTFIPIIANGLAGANAKLKGIPLTQEMKESFKATATNCFNLGGFIGTLLTVPIAKRFGRKPMFFVYYLLSAAALLAAFGLNLTPEQRLYMYFPIGLTVFGVFGSFTYYLPELYPTRLRGTGAGFCYNTGRFVASAGPFLVGYIASQGAGTLASAMQTQYYVGFVPLLGLLTLPLVIETKGRALLD